MIVVASEHNDHCCIHPKDDLNYITTKIHTTATSQNIKMNKQTSYYDFMITITFTSQNGYLPIPMGEVIF